MYLYYKGVSGSVVTCGVCGERFGCALYIRSLVDKYYYYLLTELGVVTEKMN